MQHIGTQIKRTFAKSKETERGEMMRYFCQRINYDRASDGYPPITMGRMGKTLEKIPTKDLYYLKTVCDDSRHFSKKFWWLLNPKNHEDYDKLISNGRELQHRKVGEPNRSGRSRSTQ